MSTGTHEMKENLIQIVQCLLSEMEADTIILSKRESGQPAQFTNMEFMKSPRADVLAKILKCERKILRAG